MALLGARNQRRGSPLALIFSVVVNTETAEHAFRLDRAKQRENLVTIVDEVAHEVY
jgi:hypothetical protein